MTDAQVAIVASVALAGVAGLAAFAFWLFRQSWMRFERSLEREREAREVAMQREREMFLKLYKDERDARDAVLKEEREGRVSDRHDARDELAIVANKLGAHELYCAREYVSYPRLSAELEQRLAPLIKGQARLFEKIDQMKSA